MHHIRYPHNNKKKASKPNRQIDKRLKAGIVKRVVSKFVAPVFLVKKKDAGSYQFVVSYKEEY